MICHHYKCIFVHIPKTAGQSIEHVFLDLLDLKWQTRAPLLLRHNDRPELGPPNLAHLKADEYVQFKYLTKEMFEEYFKFAFVRNPWSRMVSIYKYLGYNQKCHFKAFLLGEFKNKILRDKYWFVCPQSDFIYSDNRKLLVDYVGRFENLQNDFDFVCKEIGLPLTQLPLVNEHNRKATNHILSSTRSTLKEMIKNFLCIHKIRKIPDYNNYQKYYDKESIDFVSQLYQKDIELFGYDFEQDSVVL